MAKIPLSHHHRDAKKILAAALGNYHQLNTSLAVSCSTRKPKPGETQEELDSRATVYQERADIALALQSQAQPVPPKE